MASDVPLGLPGIVLQEVLSGIRSHRQFSDLTAKLLASFAVVPEGVPEHVEAARVKNTCLGKGLNVSGVDCLIAACAITGNHDSSPLTRTSKRLRCTRASGSSGATTSHN